MRLLLVEDDARIARFVAKGLREHTYAVDVSATGEYALLEYLARNAGRVVRRAEIAEHVWDETFDPFSNLIEVYINRVRRKIDADSAKPLLHTRRGVGYVLGTEADLPDADSNEESASSRSRMRTPSSIRKNHA